MASSTSLELNLSLKPSYVPKTITELLKDLSHVDNASDKLAVLNDYINQHEEELRSIMAFKRQLPQCMLLLMEALGTLKNEYMNIKNGMETENGRPLGEFLANKGKYYEQQMDKVNYESKRKGLMSCFSPQLWNSICSTCENKKLKTAMDLFQGQNPNPISLKESNSKPEKVSNNSNNVILRGSCSKFASGVVTEAGLCGLNLRADGNGTLNYHPRPLTLPIWKNNRRTWTPELHARFVEALNLLGGIQVATPKQIREVMQVEGLTNDQVKSHLQKYRLHRRMLPENYGECSGNFQDPWLPQIYYGEPLSPEDSDDENNNNGNPEECCKGKQKNLKSNDADL